MISWRLNTVLRCARFFLWYAKTNMLFQSCLGLMPLSIAPCSRFLLVSLWGVSQLTSPSVSYPSSWSVASSSGVSSSSAASTWFMIQMRLTFFVWISFFTFFSFWLRLWWCSFFRKFFALKFCTLTFFCRCLLLCFGFYYYAVVSVAVSWC